LTIMKKLFLTLTLALAAFAAKSQGVLQYDWHGDSGIFQGSFQVHDGVTDFTTDPTYWQSFTVTSSQFPTLTNSYWQPTELAGATHHFNGVNDGDLIIGMQTWTSYGGLSAWSTGIGFNSTAPESGHWALVPEPSCAALLGLGLLGLYVKRAASR
jgi:hypothetical protein